MLDRFINKFRHLSLQQYLVIMIILILILVTAILLTISYLQAAEVTSRLDGYFQEYTEKNIIERVSLVDTGWKLSENRLNQKMELAFTPYLNAYSAGRGNISHSELLRLKNSISTSINETVDLYIINKNGVIVNSTVPAVLTLNLSQNPDYARKIPIMINGSRFVPDRVVRSYTDAHATNITGKLRKFGFYPTPDHKYLLEIGISDISFEDYQTNLSYYLISDEMDDINPYLDQIRIFDIHKNLFIKGGLIPSDTLDLITSKRLDQVIIRRSDVTYQDTESEERVHYLFIDQDGPDTVSDMSVIVEVTYSNSLLASERSQILFFFSAVGCFSVFIGILLTLWASRLITKPISHIVEDVDLIAQGDLDHRITSMEVSEFIKLEQSITLMIRQIRMITEDIERRKTEMSIAAEIQQSFLPESLPHIRGYTLAARTIPAKEVGGDFYDAITYEIPCSQEGGGKNPNSGRFGLIIADVSGKGVPAALFMALCRTIMRVSSKNEPDMRDAVTQANRFISADARTGMFVSLFSLIVTEDQDQISYVNAGHNPPIHYHASERRSEMLHEGGVVLGVDDNVRFYKIETSMSAGDIIVMYTDGVTEAIDTDTREYGTERLMEVVIGNAHLSAEAIIDLILSDVGEFTKGCDQFDDITLVVLKRE